ncbi:MAG: hypothetical protein FJ109_12525 [Deltaproteobacteria bacterium]|nr:hypothetical protein [Deltaproteobacteria bacterium]
MKTLLRLLIACGLFLLVAGCATEEDSVVFPSQGEEETVTVTFALSSLEAGLDLSKIKTFRIRVYPSTPLSEDEVEPLFDSLKVHGCFNAGGTDIKIQDLKAGSDRFVYYQGYSDGTCGPLALVALGLRGGIRIEKRSALQSEAAKLSCTADDVCISEIHPDAFCDCQKDVDANKKKLPYCKTGVTSTCAVTPPVYVPLYEVGKFNRLPMPSSDLKAEASKVSCEGDSDCKSFHKAAVCDLEQLFCEVTGLFPFSPQRPRAFHSALSLGNGRILLTGGFNRSFGDDYYAGAPFFEVFNPYTGMFETPALQDNWGGQDVALHQASLIGDNRVVVSGGLTQMKISYPKGDSLKLRWEIPQQYAQGAGCADTKCSNFSKTVIVGNYVDGPVMSGSVEDRLFAHRSTWLKNGDGSSLLLTGGLVVSDSGQVTPSNQHTLCNAADILANDPSFACIKSENGDTFPPRYSHAAACLVGGASANQACEEYFVFGGVDDGQPSGEVFSSSDEEFNVLIDFTEVTSLNKVHFSELARVEADDKQPAKLYTFGGVDKVNRDSAGGALLLDFPAPSVQPQQVNVNLGNDALTTAGLDLKDLDNPADVYRLFHTVSVIDGGRIMLVGGLGADNLPTKKVLFFEEPATHALTYIAHSTLRDARFGHTATVIQSGLLKGAVLVVGGFTVTDKASGTVEFADGAEIYIPSP